MSNPSNKAIGATLHKAGVSFRVWAPFAESVAVSGTFNGWGEYPLIKDKAGYWDGFVEKAKSGQEYKFVIKNGPNTFRKNDPRALHFTTAAGNSVIASTHFDWGSTTFKPLPVEQQVIYEMHIGTFNRPDPAMTGTFETAASRLEYLADMGVTTIELMPVSSMSMEREWWGYTPEYIYAVENLYGGRHQMLEFVKAAHEKGIGVILDVVYNHFGPDKNLDLWQFDGWSENGKGGIYFYNDWRGSTPWGETRPDYGREEVQEFLLDNVRMWLREFKLDGLRVDSTIFIRNAVGHNDDPSTDLPDGWKLLQQINQVSRKINPEALVIAEDMGANHYMTKPLSEGGAGFNAQWQVDFPYVLRCALNAINDVDRDIQAVADKLQKSFNGNALQRVIYSDSHDSAANGAARLNEEISPGNPSSIYARQRLLLASTIIMSTPGIPMLLQGEEFLQGGSFNDWQALEWDKADQFAGIVLAHKHLIALRKNVYGNSRGLTGESIKILHLNNEAKVLAYHRWKDGGPQDDVVIVINFANKSYKKYDIDFPRSGTWQVRFNSTWEGYSPDFKDLQMAEVIVEASQGGLVLPPYSAIILSQDA